ncbi:MAG: hypothetical protein LUQ07_07535 [Methanospirillum sp.]|nr:hypothetical protein [Methanospirillum sp.]
MNQVFVTSGYALLACAILAGAGLAFADSATSSIVCTGAAWVSSSVISQGQTYAASLFTTDPAVLFRELSAGKMVKVTTDARSSGPMGIDEYSGQTVNRTGDNSECLFEEAGNRSLRRDEIRTFGLLSNGTYHSVRGLNAETSALTMMNGTGLVLTRGESSDGNRTITSASDVAGQLNISEQMVFGKES